MIDKSKLASLVFTLLLSGCASPVATELKAPDGTSLRNVKCNIDSQKCFVLASESCKQTNGTYKVIASHSNAGGTLVDAIPGPITWYNMTFVCGPSDGKMPNFPFRGERFSNSPTLDIRIKN
jgi:hypothetical protein